MDNWADRIDRHIWDSLRGATSDTQISSRLLKGAAQEFSGPLAVEEAAGESTRYGAGDQVVQGAAFRLTDETPVPLAFGQPGISGPTLREIGTGVEILGNGRYRHEVELTVQERLNEILVDSGPLEPILAHLLSARGKFLRPKMVISSAYACIPCLRYKKRYARCSVQSARPGSQSGWKPGRTGSGIRNSASAGRNPELDNHMIDMITDVAAAFEMVHMASLVHDDIIDGSSERRGLPVIHSVWGIHSAILAGDYLFSRANNTVLKYARLGIAGCLTDAVELMCRGEVAQDSRFYDPGVTVDDYFYQTGRKTAALIGAACKAGAMAVKAPREDQEHLWRFGIKVGTAFQIVDDILDLVSDEKLLGKPVFTDLRRGVLTLPLIYAMETEVRQDILCCLSKKTVPSHKIPELRRKLVSGGSVRRAANAACILLASARQDLSLLPGSTGKDSLLQMSAQLDERAVSFGGIWR